MVVLERSSTVKQRRMIRLRMLKTVELRELWASSHTGGQTGRERERVNEQKDGVNHR